MEKPLRVLQVFGSLDMGGAESRMMDVYRKIDSSKISFDFVSLTKGNQYFEQEIESLSGKIYRINSPREVGIWNHIKELRNCMRKGNYDAVHAHTSYHCGMVMFAAWLENIPVRIAHARTTGTKSVSRKKSIEIAVGRFLIKRFSTNRFAISDEAGRFLFGKSSFEIVPNAIDFEKYQNASKKLICDYKSEFRIPENFVIIGQIGRFDIMKNHKFSVEWFEQFENKHNNYILVFVGDGTLRKDIELLVKEKGLENKVVFTGIRNDIPKLIHVFDVLLFPSTFEGLGGVAIEAQAAGVPVVESDTIPEETDLLLGLVKRCSLTHGFDEWNSAIEGSTRLTIPNEDFIKKQFYSKGYSLSSTIETFIKAYNQEK